VIGRGSPRNAARRLLVECLLALGQRREKIADLAAGVDWEDFLAVARRHAVAEGVHLSLDRHGVAPPERCRSALREDHLLAAARNTVLISEAARVQGALAAKGVESLLLKGTALLASIPSAIGLRHVGDVDLLVSPGDLPRAEEIACALGCRPLARPGLAHDGSPLAPEVLHHSPPLVTPAGATLELHVRPGHVRSTAGWSQTLFADAVTTSWRGVTLRLPSIDHQLALLSEHVFDGHRDDRRFLPRHLGDLALLTSAGASMERAGLLAGAEESVGRSRALLDEASRGEAVAERIFLRPLDRFRSRLDAGMGAIRAARSRGGAWRAFLPSHTFMAARYGVPSRSPRIPLLYLWRPLDVAWRILSGR
jgi:hypothetical protein